MLFSVSAGSEFVDQDSLDGQLPSSSRSLVHDNPSGLTPSPISPSHHEGGAGMPPPAPPPMNFTKGPGAQKKRHRKLNPETEDTMSEDESSSGPPSKSNSPRGDSPKENAGHFSPAASTASANQNAGHKSNNQSGSSASAKAGSAINLNPFSGVLWERREPL